MIDSTMSASPYNRFESAVSSRISNDISNGTISQTDGSALASALGDISSSLQSGGTSSSSSSQFDPQQFRAKLGSLIDGEVKSGKLTADQATELKSVLTPKGGAHGAGGARGSHHKRDADGDNDGDQAGSSTDTTSDTTNSSSASSSSDPLQNFLKLLQDTQQQLQTASYGTSGQQTAASSSQDPLLLDLQA